MTTAVIVGASLAGLRAAESLRQREFTGRIVVVGAEPHLPYDRPPLSKKFFSGEWDADRIMLRRPEILADLGIEWMLGRRATALDAAGRRVVLEDGTSVDFDGLIIATGGVARRLPGAPPLEGVHVLRTVDDAEALRAELAPGKRMVIIGAGFIGLEVAATASARGVDVTVLEGLDAPLVRALGAEMGRAIGEGHRRRGVAIRCGARIERLVGDGRVTGVELSGGEVVPADVLLLCIGVAPATDWLSGSTIRVDDGVLCDEALGAGAPGVFAAGDVARWPNGLFTDVEPMMRVEHWTTAAEQGAHAARNLKAWFDGETAEPYSAVPFFWSDQFDMRIQFLGRAVADPHIDVVAGSPESGQWCAVYSNGSRVTGVLGVSMPKLVMPSRSLVEQRVSVAEALSHFAGVTGV